MMDFGAITLGLHLMSHHLPERDGLSDINPGVYVLTERGITAGVLRNSLGRLSVYGGWSTDIGPFSLTLGAMRYSRPDSYTVLPLAIPSYKVTENVRLSLIPSVRGSAALVHLSVEFKP